MTETATASAFTTLHSEFLKVRGLGSSEHVRGLRADAMARFEERGLPSPRDEEWRHTSLSALAQSSFAFANGRPAAPGAFDALRLPAFEAVFVDGRFQPDLSSLAGLPAGVEIVSLATRLATPSETIVAHLARVAADAERPFTALNTAFLEDGAYVAVPAGVVVEKPIHILHYATGGRTPLPLLSPRTLIVAGRNAQARVIETYAGRDGYFTNAVTEVVLDDDAVVEHYKRQHESETAFHVGHIEARQARGSHFNSYSFAFGGALSRTDIDVRFAGEGAECGLYGLFIGHGSQQIDHHTLIDHATPRCASRELYKGVLDDKARGVFFGTIVVRPDAQKTDAHQTNKNLLLSRDALVNSTPRLQIEADDVRCKHGSTTGQIDAAALFYLRSRGIGEAEARSMMTYAFAADVVERIQVASLRAAVAAHLGQLLPGAGQIAGFEERHV